ncbi:MAG: 2-oxo acid dehydrogenase subunit E2 [Aquaticitalea sp.]
MNTLIETVKTPLDSVNDDSVIITQVFVEAGQKVSPNTILAEIETSKALVDIICDTEGYVKSFCKPDQEVMIGETLFEIHEQELSKEELVQINSEQDKAPNYSNQKEITKSLQVVAKTEFSKRAKELVEQYAMDVSAFKHQQFVTSKDIDAILNPSSTVAKSIPVHKAISEAISTATSLSNTAQAIGKQKTNEATYLSSVNATGLVSRLTISIDASLEAISKSQNFITSTPLPMIAHEVSRLLIKYPNLNSYFDNNEKRFYNDINVGIAVDNGVNGLKVASIYNCDSKNLHEIEEDISDISLKYNENKLSLQDISSSTFTITDLFSAGVTNFHPLINFNNSAILGICALKNKSFDIELSFDHRISNGLEVSKFLTDLKSRIENRLFAYNQKKRQRELNSVECYQCLRPISDDLDGKIYFINVSNSKMDSHICSNCFNGF